MVTSKRLTGIPSLAYQGVEASTPPNMNIETRAPNSTDSKNFNIGDFWLHYRPGFPAPGNHDDLYVLISLERDVAKWVNFFDDAGLNTLTGNVGGAIPPDAMDNINVLAGAGTGLSFSGNPGTNTLTLITSGGGPLLQTITGDTGGAVQPDAAGNINLLSQTVTQGAGSSVSFSAPGGNTVQLNVTDGSDNTILGFQAGNGGLTGNRNTGLGHSFIRSLTSGNDNCGLGWQTLTSTTTGSSNCAYGSTSLNALTTGSTNSGFGFDTLGSLTTGSANCAFGAGALNGITTGSSNIVLGLDAATNYTGAESNNIIIGNSGTLGESDTIRIGDAQTSCFVQGIAGVTVSNVLDVVIDSATGQLGTIASGGGVAGQNSFSATQAPALGVITSGAGIEYMGIVGGALTELFDPDNVFNPGDGAVTPATFTAPADGNYQFLYTVTLNPFAVSEFLTTIFSIGLIVNATPAGGSYTTGGMFPGGGIGTKQLWETVNIVIPLSMGDTVTFGLQYSGTPATASFAGSGGSFSLMTGITNWISGFRVS